MAKTPLAPPEPPVRAARNRIVHGYTVYLKVDGGDGSFLWRELPEVKAQGITAERALDAAFAAGLEIGGTYRVVETAKTETFETETETRPVIRRA